LRASGRTAVRLYHRAGHRGPPGDHHLLRGRGPAGHALGPGALRRRGHSALRRRHGRLPRPCLIHRRAGQTDPMSVDAIHTDEELRARLTPEQYEVTQHGGTERAFTGAYVNTKDPGVYRCIVCHAELFRSDTKYDSGSGWPSFTEPVSTDRVKLLTDT